MDCAVEAGATHVVMGDRQHLLPIGIFPGIAMVTPAEFLLAAAMASFTIQKTFAIAGWQVRLTG